MAFIPAPGTAKVQVVFNDAGGIVVNNYHVSNGGSEWIESELKDIAEVFRNWLQEEWNLFAPGDVVVERVVCTDLSVENGAQVIKTYFPTITGISGGTSMPRNVTICMNWRTGLAGRSFRGRTFHVGTNTGLLVSGQYNLINPSMRDLIVTCYDDLRQRVIDNQPGAFMVVVSYMSDGVFRSEAVSTPIVSVDTDLRVDTLRPRMYARPT